MYNTRSLFLFVIYNQHVTPNLFQHLGYIELQVLPWLEKVYLAKRRNVVGEPDTFCSRARTSSYP